jgi:hypothetical protein
MVFPMRLQAFVPRSESIFVFSAVMACYAYFLGGLMNAVIRTFHGAVHPVSLLPDSLYWFTIVIDALLMAATFEVLRWLRASAPIQVVLVSALLALSRALSDPLWSLLVLPVYALCALSYVYWRGRGLWQAFGVILLIQAFYDIVPAFRAIFPAVPNA